MILLPGGIKPVEHILHSAHKSYFADAMLKGRSCSVCTRAIEQENQWIGYCLTGYTRNERIMKWMSLQCELFESCSWVQLSVPSLKVVAKKEEIFLQYHLPNVILTPYGSVILYYGHDGFPQETFHLSVHSQDTDNIFYGRVAVTAGFMGIPTGMIPARAHCHWYLGSRGKMKTPWHVAEEMAGKGWDISAAAFLQANSDCMRKQSLHSASFLCCRQGLKPTREGTSGASSDSELKNYWGTAAQGALFWRPVEATK